MCMKCAIQINLPCLALPSHHWSMLIGRWSLSKLVTFDLQHAKCLLGLSAFVFYTWLPVRYVRDHVERGGCITWLPTK